MSETAGSMSVCVAAQQDAKVAPNALNQLTAYIRSLCPEVGQEAYEKVLAAQHQIRFLLASNPHTASVRVYMYGSILTLGSWDGKGDLDLAVIEPDRWDAGTWPPQKIDATMAKIVEALAVVGTKDLLPLYSARIPIITQKVPQERKLTDVSTVNKGYSLTLGGATDPKELLLDDEANSNGKLTIEPNNTAIHFPHWKDALQFMCSKHIPDSLGWGWQSPHFSPEMLGIDFDLSLRGSGIAVSWLLRRYFQQSSLARVGTIFLKHWGKATRLNNPNQGYFNSFATSVLWIYFLIQTKRISFVDPTPFQTQPTASYLDVAPFIPLIEEQERDNDTFWLDVSNTIFKFFNFYANEFNWDTHVVSICQEHCVTKKELNWVFEKEKRVGSPVYYRICVQEPLEPDVNISRRLDGRKKGAASVRPFFQRALNALKDDKFERLFMS